MANALFNAFKQALLDNTTAINLASGGDTVKATLIDTADETFAATDTTYVQGASGITDAAKVAVSAALTSPTVTNGTFNTAGFTWSTVSGDQSEAIILWDDSTTTAIADLLIAWYDTGIN